MDKYNSDLGFYLPLGSSRDEKNLVLPLGAGLDRHPLVGVILLLGYSGFLSGSVFLLALCSFYGPRGIQVDLKKHQ